MIVGIPSGEYERVRERVLPFLHNFASRSLGRWRVSELEQAICDAEKQMWLINDCQALALTSVGHESVNIDHCAGLRRHEWENDLGNEIEAWARHMEKKRVISMVRPGWAGLARERGYVEVHREVVKEL
jgi:hypothetical protein